MYLNRDMDGGPFLDYFLPILGGQKATVSDSIEGWCVANNLGAFRVSIRMDDWTEGRHGRMMRRADSGEASFLTPTSFTIYNNNPLSYVVVSRSPQWRSQNEVV
jgi:hypothetical protein